MSRSPSGRLSTPSPLAHSYSITSPPTFPPPTYAVPFTPALGLQIAPLKTPYYEGTAALYLREGGDSKRVIIVTARHVALPVYNNDLYHCKQPRTPAHEIIILGTSAYENTLKAMMAKIGRELILVDSYDREIKALGPAAEGEDPDVTASREDFEDKLARAKIRPSRISTRSTVRSPSIGPW